MKKLLAHRLDQCDVFEHYFEKFAEFFIVTLIIIWIRVIDLDPFRIGYTPKNYFKDVKNFFSRAWRQLAKLIMTLHPGRE